MFKARTSLFFLKDTLSIGITYVVLYDVYMRASWKKTNILVDSDNACKLQTTIYGPRVHPIKVLLYCHGNKNTLRYNYKHI